MPRQAADQLWGWEGGRARGLDRCQRMGTPRKGGREDTYVEGLSNPHHSRLFLRQPNPCIEFGKKHMLNPNTFKDFLCRNKNNDPILPFFVLLPIPGGLSSI